MRINHNIAALNTYRQLGQANQANSNSMEKLSSGLRINKAADDAAGLAISEKMRGQIRGLEQSERNAQDGISMIQTAEGALNETQSILQRMRELSTQASNGSLTNDDRSKLQNEIVKLNSEVDRIANDTEFNTKKLLNGDLSAATEAQGDILESAGIQSTEAIIGGDLSENAVTIESGVNDSVDFTDEAGNTSSITLSAGTYDADALAAEMNTQMDANTDLADLDVGTSGGKLTFTDTDTTDTSGFAVLSTGSANSDLGIDTSSSTAVADGATATASAAVAIDDGYYVSEGTNDQFNISMNGLDPVTIDLVDSDQGFTHDQLIDQVNQKFKDSDIAVTASKNQDGTGIVFSADNAGDSFEITEGNNALGSLNIANDGATSGGQYVSGLSDNQGDSLGIKTGDTININGEINGSSISEGSLTINSETTLSDLTGEIENTLNLSAGSVSLNSDNEIVVNGESGEDNDIQKLSLSIDGNDKFNNHFSNFAETQDAQDATTNDNASFHIGANQGQTMEVNIAEMTTGALSLSSVDISTQQGAENSMTVINNAIETVSSERSKMGAVQNRLEHTINNLGTSSENLTAAESRIRDVDMAKEMMSQTKASILSQASQSMLAKANQMPQGVLQLLR